MKQDRGRFRLAAQNAILAAAFVGILCGPAATSIQAASPTCSKDGPAMRWLRSIETQDWPAMADLLARDSNYSDPTMVYYDRPAIALAGKASIVDFWRKSSDASGAQDIRYEVIRCFETAGVTVLTLELSISVSGRFWGIAKDRIELSGSQTTVVHASGNEIRRVVDYVDYAGAGTQLAALRQKYGASTGNEEDPRR